VPIFGLDELLSVIRSEHREREHKLAELLRRRELEPAKAAELGTRVNELLARAEAKSPPPSHESVALGILSLLALESPP
jgi:hypothetical protein